MCSVLRSERVCVCRAAHAIGHSGLSIVQIVHEDIHNVP